MAFVEAVRAITDTGAVKGWHFDAEGMRVVNQPYLQAMAEGDIAGHTPFNKFGRVANVNTAEVDVVSWAATYTFPATGGEQMRVVSSSTSDTGAGTGVQKIKIEYLNNLNATLTEEVTLSGTTPVSTVSTVIRRINRVYASAVGTGGKAAGTIIIYHLTNPTPIYGQIDLGLTQSRQLVYTVPAGQTLYIVESNLSSGVGATTNKVEYVTFTYRAMVDPGTRTLSTIMYPEAEIGVINQAFRLVFESPLKIPATADFKVSAIGDTSNGVTCTAAVRGWLE